MTHTRTHAHTKTGLSHDSTHTPIIPSITVRALHEAPECDERAPLQHVHIAACVLSQHSSQSFSLDQCVVRGKQYGTGRKSRRRKSNGKRNRLSSIFPSLQRSRLLQHQHHSRHTHTHTVFAKVRTLYTPGVDYIH